MPSPWFQPHTHGRMRTYARCQMCARRLKLAPVRRRRIVKVIPLLAVAPDIPRGAPPPTRKWVTWEEVGIGLTIALGFWVTLLACAVLLFLS